MNEDLKDSVKGFLGEDGPNDEGTTSSKSGSCVVCLRNIKETTVTGAVY